MGFKIICDKCKSTDVAISSVINIYDHVEIAFICNNCKHTEEQSC